MKWGKPPRTNMMHLSKRLMKNTMEHLQTANSLSKGLPMADRREKDMAIAAAMASLLGSRCILDRCRPNKPINPINRVR